MELSDFGKRFSGKIGIGELMDDLGNALVADPAPLMLGGGNPSHVPQVQALFRKRMEAILAEPGEFERLIGNYDTPQGSKNFVEALVALFRNEFGWDLGPENVALTNGSQNSFFYLFNLFAGRFGDSRRKKILLPLAPEYIGYSEVGLEKDFFWANRPEISRLDDHMFKYQVDFESLEITDEVGAICFSRPTNPTGNVVTDEEVNRLRELANRHGVPLVIDNAYGTPFPNIIYEDVRPVWDENTIVCMSLSKLGLPSLRTGIVIAQEEIIRIVSRMTSVFSLAPGGVGPGLALDLVSSGEITRISREIIRPFYESKVKRAVAQLREEMSGVPFSIHKPEGALFLWLWFEDLPITNRELYERLKKKGVLVVSGHYFFPGLDEPWRHKDECIRVTYAQDDEVVEKGLSIIADEVKQLYSSQ
ncbi:MAG: valine--pyruvate transaminase [Opitutales bacterium]